MDGYMACCGWMVVRRGRAAFVADGRMLCVLKCKRLSQVILQQPLALALLSVRKAGTLFVGCPTIMT